MTIFEAIATGNLEEATKLLSADATIVNHLYYDQGGIYPLHWAAHHGQLEIAQLLLEHGANADQESEGDKWTPLHWAAQISHTNLVRLLLDHGAQVNKTAQTDSGPQTSLALAAENLQRIATEDTQLATMKLLLQRGAKITADESEWTPLHWAACNGQTKILALLLAHGADINAFTHEDHTPLHMAANNEHPEAVQQLLAEGADVTLADYEEGWTALHQAVHRNRPDIIKALIAAGANIHQEDLDGDSALSMAEDSDIPNLQADMLKWHLLYQYQPQLRQYRAALNPLLAERIYADYELDTGELNRLPTEILLHIADCLYHIPIELNEAKQQIVREVTAAIHTHLQTRGDALMFDVLRGKHPIQNRLNQAALNIPQEKAWCFNPESDRLLMLCKTPLLHSQSGLEILGDVLPEQAKTDMLGAEPPERKALELSVN